MRTSLKYFVVLFIAISCSFIADAQPSKKLITIHVAPEQVNWNYVIGEEAKFKVSVFKNDYPLQNVKVEYQIAPEGTTAGLNGTIIFKEGIGIIKAGTMDQPGFLKCAVKVEYNGIVYKNYAKAGFDVDKIKPTTKLPPDFKSFWEKSKEELSEVPIHPVLTLLPSQCTDKVEVYKISMQNIRGKIYGMLCKPKKEGKYPAVLFLPGAGVSPTKAHPWGAQHGVITLEIGIHGIPPDLEGDIYKDLKAGSLNRYFTAHMDDKDEYYYKRVYLGCIRSVDFIHTLPFFDGENLAVTGGSQGGALSIVTTALDDRVDCLAALHPALCDLTGFIHGRAGGWPQIFRTEEDQIPQRIETSKYFDVVNFARFIKVPGWYSWGYNDNICPPTSIYSAYNVITAPKEKHVYLSSGHWMYPEQNRQRMTWIYDQLLK